MRISDWSSDVCSSDLKGYVVSCGQRQTAAEGCMTLLDENGAVLGRGDDAGGNRLIGTPRWKATFSTEYVKPLSSAIDALVQLDGVSTSTVSGSEIGRAPGGQELGSTCGFRGWSC